MALTDDQRADFAKYAKNPQTWVLAARRSLAVAKLLRQRKEVLTREPHRDFFEFSGCHYASYFHAAMAVENALKAAMISRDPSIVEEGTLNIKKFGAKSGHALLDPATAILGSLTDNERQVLTKLEEYVWAGRYTVPAKGDVLYDGPRMDNMRTAPADEAAIIDSLVQRAIEHVL